MITRTTSSQINDSLVKYMAKTQVTLNDLAKQLSTHKKLNSITDDAVAARAVLGANKSINLYNSYKANMQNAQFELTAAEDALKHAETQASRASDIALMASTTVYGKEELNAYKQEVDGIIGTMESLANTKHLDSYIFSGTAALKQTYSSEKAPEQTFVANDDGSYTKTVMKDDGAAVRYDITFDAGADKWMVTETEIDAAGNEGTPSSPREAVDEDWKIENSVEVKYNGTNTRKTVLIGDDGLEENVNVLGSDIFGRGKVTTTTDYKPENVAANKGKPVAKVETSGEGGLISSLYELSAAIDAGDQEAIQHSLAGLNGGVNTLSENKAVIGISSNRFSTLSDAYDNNLTNLTSLKSNLEDADLAQVITDWMSQQYSLQAAYSVSSQMMNLSIMNYV